jgi:hypothetical protein
MATSETEARIRRLHARLGQAEHRTETLAGRTGRLSQNLVGFNQVGADFGGCTTTITGKVIGGDAAAAGLAGATLDVTGHVSGIAYGTFALAAGTYAIDLSLDPADTSLDLVATGPGARFATNTALNQPVTRCDANALADIQATPATGYHYMTGVQACQYPLKGVLSYSDSSIGTGTATWDGTRWTDCKVAASRAAGACAAGVNAAVFLNFNTNGTASGSFAAATSGGCPTASTCATVGPTTGGFGTGVGGHTAKTCPDNTPTLFSMTFPHTIGTVNGAAMFDPAGSITIFET